MAHMQSPPDHWRVGILFSQTGVTSAIEQTQLNGSLLAIEEINASGGVLGRIIEPVIYDPEANPARFRELALRLIIEDDINVIFGCYMSSTRKAVLPVVEKCNALLFYPTLYEGFEFSPNVIYTGAAPNQNSVQLAHFLIENFGPRFYLVGSDYIYPYESNRIMKDLVHQLGGDIAGERYFPLTAKPGDYDAVLDDIRTQRPDVIFSTVVGASTAHFYRAYAAAGLSPDETPIASLTTSEAEIQTIGAAASAGHITAAPYFESLPTAENQLFVTAFKEKFGNDSPVTSGAEAAYFQMYLFAEGLKRSESTATERLRENMMGAEFSAPQGRVRIDPENGHVYLWPRIGRIGADAQFEVIAESTAAVKPDPYLVSPGANDWSLRQFKPLVTSDPQNRREVN